MRLFIIKTLKIKEVIMKDFYNTPFIVLAVISFIISVLVVRYFVKKNNMIEEHKDEDIYFKYIKWKTKEDKLIDQKIRRRH